MASSEHSRAPVFFLMGPTAAGKTAVAMELVQRFPLEIISVDSSLVYRGMDIGTGKPTAEELARAPHRLIDIREPQQTYSAASFCTDARAEISDVFARGNFPLLVGGSMMYFHALQYGLSRLPAADQAIREQLASEAAQTGWPAMHRRLQAIDGQMAARIDPNDSQRIQRALEIAEITGGPPSVAMAQNRGDPLPHTVKTLVINPQDRAVLHQRIALRFRRMLAAGLVQEVETLLQKPAVHAELPAMRMVGYRQALKYLNGEYDREELENRGIYATRQLAKRQLTWLRRQYGSAFSRAIDPDGQDYYNKVTCVISRSLETVE